MSNWSSGYVTDLGYTYGFYRELTPNLLAMASLSSGHSNFSPDEKFTFCELGSGQGFTSNLIAAANPQGEFYATDFNPAQINTASELAKAAGTSNLHFSEDSFEEFGRRDDLPAFDVIAFHGIYSWINEDNRRHIVNFVKKRLKPGGLVYNSYNALPGWAPAAPMRHLLYLHGKMQGGPTGARLAPALAFVEKLISQNAAYFRGNPSVATRFEKLKGQNRNYLAHEYMNDAWTLLYHSDVAEEMSDAKLAYLTQASLLEHVDAINLTKEHRALLAELPDPTFRETVRDFLTGQQFRRDIFVKGVSPLSMMELRRQWLALRVVATSRKEAFNFKVKGLLGEAELNRDVYEPLVDAMQDGPRLVSDLIKIKAVADLGWGRLVEALTLLVGVGYLAPCLSAQGDSQRLKRVRQFNAAVTARAEFSNELHFLASSLTGGGEQVDRVAQLFMLARARKVDPAQFAWDTLNSQGQRVVKDGKPVESPEENIAELRTRYADFEKRLPVLQQLGIA